MDLYDIQMTLQSKCMGIAEKVQCWQAGHARIELYEGCMGIPWTISDKDAIRIWPQQFSAQLHSRTVEKYPYRNTNLTHVMFNYGVAYGMRMILMELTFFLNNKTGRNELYWASAHGAGGSEGWLNSEYRQMRQAIRQRFGRSDYSTFDWSRWDYTGDGGKVLARHTCSMAYPGHAKLDWFRMDVYDYLHSAEPMPPCTPTTVDYNVQDPANDFMLVEVFSDQERRPPIPGV